MKSGCRFFACLFIGLMCLSLSGCLEDVSGSGNATAAFTLGVTDTPVDGAQSVVIAFTGVDLMSSSGLQSARFVGERQVNLLRYQGDDSAILVNGMGVINGDFQWIRLNIDPANSYIVTSDGARYPITFSNSDQTGLKLANPFTVAAGSNAYYVVDFNLRASILQSNDNGITSYSFTPILRLIDATESGGISGTVPSTLSLGGTPISSPSCDPAVYVYSGSVTTPGGYKLTSGASPLTSTSVWLDNRTGDYAYNIGFLAPGTYTLAVTCAADDATGSSGLNFSTSHTATVTAGSNTTQNF